MASLLVLHGYTMNAAVMRAHLGPLDPRLASFVDLAYPDAPHLCSAASIERLAAFREASRLEPPHRTWWDATDDGRDYRGWPETRAFIRGRMEEGVVGVLGFSQGAILGAAIAALSAAGELPPIRFAVLVAGRQPRADVFQPFFTKPVAIPSLHVWSTTDPLATVSGELVEAFAEAGREAWTWSGPHCVPTRGAGADVIARFVERHV